MPDCLRVIVAVPNVAECAAIADWLADEGFEPVERPTARAAAEEMQSHAFDLLLADASFAFGDGLNRPGRSRNPLTPAVVVGDSAAADHCKAVGWAIYLARPVDYAMLLATVSMAILEGRPTRRSARKSVSRFAAMVNGAPAHIIDISNEGVRLEMPRDRRLPPPYFTVQVPLIGLGVTVQRMWMKPLPGKGGLEVIWCGGALAENPDRAEAWRAWVDTIPAASGPPPDSLKIIQ